MLIISVIAAAFLATTTITAQSLSISIDDRAQILVIGTYHMANPGRDLINMPVDDVTTPERQKEVEELVSRLARFNPTHVAVEVTPERAAELEKAYRQFVETAKLPGLSETYQVGFRLAERLELNGVHPVDHSREMEIAGLIGWIGANDPTGMAYLQQTIGAIQKRNHEIMEGSVSEIFARLNSTEQDQLHGGYLWLAQKGSSSDPIGAELVAGWYDRNLKIFANVARLAEDPDARVLVLVGAAHATLLREFVRHAPNLELIDTRLFLR